MFKVPAGLEKKNALSLDESCGAARQGKGLYGSRDVQEVALQTSCRLALQGAWYSIAFRLIDGFFRYSSPVSPHVFSYIEFP